ncbi:glycosyltransferase family 2 protein [Sphingomonas sp. MMS12-HWE2-04]|uniref:glycosyltransferase family 2 protein n=1 Tax=Sphingomonas sp. MMS12-HWE2-04 TaxID=3234199 RepID=UPI00384E4F52
MKISVITAVYNNVTEIAGAIESILAQRGTDVDLVVVDGGSTDGTLEILDRYRPHFGAFVSARDGGIYPALNRGLKLATGDYVGFLHSDDLFASRDALATLFGGVGDARPDAMWGDLNYVRKADPSSVVRRWTSTDYSPRRLRWGWMPPHPTLYVRRDRFLGLQGFDETMRIAADYDFILRLFSAPGDYRYVPGTVVAMRTGGASNRSLPAMLRKSFEDATALRRAGISVTAALAGKNLGKLHQFFA